MNPPSPSDEQLISQTAEGSEDAYTELVRRYQRQVLSTAYRYTGNATAAEDMAQEVFVKVWVNAAKFKHRSRFSTWLFRITVNHCLNYQAKRKRRRTEPLDERLPDSSPSAPQSYESKQKSQLVHEAMEKLPDRQRMALILSRFEGHSYAEISAIMGVSLSSVESLIFRAKSNLKKHLAPLREQGIL